jgi:pimeloyl-ACP methyl ester carboxylesterase
MFNKYDNKKVALENGPSIGYHDEGDSSETMVLLHGLNAHSGSWQRNAGYFAQTGTARVIAPTMPPDFVIRERLPVGRYVEILEELLSKLRVSAAHLVGNSMGGWVAMRYSISHPRKVRSLVLEDTAGVAPTKEDPIELGEQELSKISVPTLIVWGENDSLIPVETANLLRSEIRRSDLVVIKGAAHVPHWEKSKEFNETVRKFIISSKTLPDG